MGNHTVNAHAWTVWRLMHRRAGIMSGFVLLAEVVRPERMRRSRHAHDGMARVLCFALDMPYYKHINVACFCPFGGRRFT